jgi:hypothetical protein
MLRLSAYLLNPTVCASMEANDAGNALFFEVQFLIQLMHGTHQF